MCSYESLPVVLVSAVDAAAADALIAEIIDNDVTESYCNESGADPVWRIVNKYYTADVRVHMLTDQQQLQLEPDKIEAHVIHLTESECSDGGNALVGRAGLREERAGAAGRDAAVRLVAASCVEPDAELDAWAARRRRELVAMREAPPAEPGPFQEQYGVERLRGALHAHAWPGMVRTRPNGTAQPPPLLGRTSSESSSEGSEGSAEDGSDVVERAEAFAAALGALEAARDTRHTDTARLDRAEQVVAAFCRALGYDLDAC